MSITAQMVKELRAKSSAGMMDCKKALSETNGDMEAAVDWLRKKGLSTASKKSGRIASEGLVGIKINNLEAAIVEVNSETDFVARNLEFQDFVKDICSIAIHSSGNVKALLEKKYPKTEQQVKEILTEKIAKIGENISIRRISSLNIDEGIISGYIHNHVEKNLGKIGVLVALQTSSNDPKINNLGKQIAMHIAAASPASISINDLSDELIQREKSVLMEQAISSGKPEDIAKKMVEGRLRKFYSEVVLLEQISVLDGETKISDLISKVSKEINSEIQVSGFVKYNLGEGIEKENKNFADEVAEQLSE